MSDAIGSDTHISGDFISVAPKEALIELTPLDSMCQVANDQLANSVNLQDYKDWVGNLALDPTEQYKIVQKMKEHQKDGLGDQVLSEGAADILAANLLKLLELAETYANRNRSTEVLTYEANRLAAQWIQTTYIDSASSARWPVYPCNNLFAPGWGICTQLKKYRPSEVKIAEVIELPKNDLTAPGPDVIIPFANNGDEEEAEEKTPIPTVEPDDSQDNTEETTVLLTSPAPSDSTSVKRVPTPKISRTVYRRSPVEKQKRQARATSHEKCVSSDVDEAMLASIGRTALIKNRTRIPLIGNTKLSQDNERVWDAYGDEARRLTIVGHDVIKIGDQPTLQIEGLRTAELLGLLIFTRQVTVRAHYLDIGFFAEGTPASRGQSITSTVTGLTAIVDADGKPLVTRTGNRGGAKFGIDDLAVFDIRHSKVYRAERQRSATIVVHKYILDGGDIPSVAEAGAIYGARSALRDISEGPLSKEQIERYQYINELVREQLEYRTDEYEEAHVLNGNHNVERRHLRALLADRLAPSWQDDAACGDVDHNVFFPAHDERKEERLEREKYAKGFCATCSVRKPCEDAGFAQNRDEAGIWGGLTKEDRNELRDKHNLL